jgi:drug/metabolite transporter (DMT)-like permease
MSVPAAYGAIIVIWSATPLAIKWSGEGPGFLFGVFGRMVLGLVVSLVLMVALRVRFPWNDAARRTYAAAALGAFGTMLCIYWAAQYIPSGIIAILFGLTPLITGLFASLWLDEESLTPAKLAGVLSALAGLVVIFGSGLSLGAHAISGIAVVLLGVVLQSAGAVLIKRVNAGLHGLAVTGGTLTIVTPLFFLAWLVFDGHSPPALPARAAASILYLGVIGSVLGFSLYFYVLKHVEANVASLITLVSPVFALILGQIVNGEPITTQVWAGAALVLGGLAIHQWGPALGRWRREGSR